VRGDRQILQSEGKITANKLAAAELRARPTSSRQIRVWGETPYTRFRSPVLLKTTLLEKPAGSNVSITGIEAESQRDRSLSGISSGSRDPYSLLIVEANSRSRDYSDHPNRASLVPIRIPRLRSGLQREELTSDSGDSVAIPLRFRAI
jgi:hypothetical protein